MHQHAVLVTGVGALIGQGIIKSLRMAGIRKVVGIDRKRNPYAEDVCDRFYQKPCDEKSPAFWEFLNTIIEKEAVDILIPGIEQDVFFFNEHRAEVGQLAVPIVLNTPLVISLGMDKWFLHNVLLETGSYAIPSFIGGNWADCLAALGEPPFLIKPRRGSGGQGQALVHHSEDFFYFRKKMRSEFMAQRLVGGDDEEYTVAVFGYGDGDSSDPVTLRRRIGLGGATWQAETVEQNEVIDNAVAVLNRAFRPMGPTNYQFRQEGDFLYLLEINPRISASTSLRAAFGYNEATMCVEHYIHGKRFGNVGMRQGRAVRYIEDYIVLK